MQPNGQPTGLEQYVLSEQATQTPLLRFVCPNAHGAPSARCSGSAKSSSSQRHMRSGGGLQRLFIYVRV